MRRLSDYNPNLAGTPCDTQVIFYESAQPGGAMLVVGGTHPDEAAGTAAALVIAENAHMNAGRLIVIPYANASGFSHTLPQEGHPDSYQITTPEGIRTVKYGARVTNPVHQWPDPTVYVEPVAHQKLAGTESRNLNRAYPGSPSGSLTSMAAYAIMELIKREKVDVAIDMHESSPEYPVNNAIVAHQNAVDTAIYASLYLADEGVDIGIEVSPTNLRGLSHREWGDNSDVLALLLESPNPAQGRLRGRTNEDLILYGQDRMYVRAASRGRLYVPFDANGQPLSVRVGRHVASVHAIASVFSELYPDREIIIDDVPDYQDILDHGVGAYLRPSA